MDLKGDKTYDFKHKLVELPAGYDTITWVNFFGHSIKGSDADSTYNQYLFFGKMLEDLFKSEHIKYGNVVKYFGEPSQYGISKNEGKDLFYFFNTKRYPNCGRLINKYETFGSNCSILVLSAGNDGIINEVHKMMFKP